METRPPAADPLAERKKALREQLLALRASIPDRADRERVLVNRVRRWLNTMPTSRLAFFWPVRGECNLVDLIAEWLSGDAKRVASLPVVEGDVLVFAAWTPQTELSMGAYDIPSPPSTAPRVTPQVMLIPCVAIDQNRYRLGYGGGYYDRTLARLSPRPVLVGVTFDCGRVKNLAPAPHDIRMDLAITESGVL
jgi:5,10-methenyltetrahydrofolate synthetase